jgi:hypothetical protein
MGRKEGVKRGKKKREKEISKISIKYFMGVRGKKGGQFKN